MLRRIWKPIILVFLFTALLLMSCAPQAATEAPAATQAPAATEVSSTAETPPAETQPAAWIDSITNDPTYPSKDWVITFTINYKNRNSAESLLTPILEVIYADNLTYCPSGIATPSGENCQSEPAPADNVPEKLYLKYDLGQYLKPGEVGAVTVSFTVKEIPPEVSLQATISGTTEVSQGNSTDSASILVSPDGMAEIKYSNGVVDIYPGEGVSVWLPNQTSGKVIHTVKSEFGFDPLSIEVMGDYHVDQSIIYLDVYDENNESVNTFAPSIIFSAVIPEDLKSAASDGNLVILLYDKVLNQWIPCDGGIDTNLRTQCDKTTIRDDGRAQINISSWTSGAGWGKR